MLSPWREYDREARVADVRRLLLLGGLRRCVRDRDRWPGGAPPGHRGATVVSLPMQQRPLGRAGLLVSRLALGTMTWGRDTALDDAARAGLRGQLRPGPVRRDLQLLRLGDRPGSHLAGGLAGPGSAGLRAGGVLAAGTGHRARGATRLRRARAGRTALVAAGSRGA